MTPRELRTLLSGADSPKAAAAAVIDSIAGAGDCDGLDRCFGIVIATGGLSPIAAAALEQALKAAETADAESDRLQKIADEVEESLQTHRQRLGTAALQNNRAALNARIEEALRDGEWLRNALAAEERGIAELTAALAEGS
jgi:hypothetical protein